MSLKILPVILITLSVTVVQAQKPEMNDTQKEHAAKADAYIINSKKKITDSFNLPVKDTITATKKSKKKYGCKRHKKSS